jgi:hypothetical protein
MKTNQADSFTYQNNIKSLKHEMEMIVAQIDNISSLIKKVYVDLEELDKCQPLIPPSENIQTPYEELGNPDSKTALEKIGDGG